MTQDEKIEALEKMKENMAECVQDDSPFYTDRLDDYMCESGMAYDEDLSDEHQEEVEALVKLLCEEIEDLINRIDVRKLLERSQSK